MPRELLLLLVGALLISLAALAGGARMRARVGRTLRAATAAAGLLCAGAALILMVSDGRDLDAGPVTVVISNELGANQVSEEIRVSLDGREVGVLKVDEQSPRARLTVSVEMAGRYEYTVKSKRRVKGREPTDVSSDGNVAIGEGGRLTVFSNSKGDTFLLPEP